MERLARAVRKARPGTILSISPNYYAFAYKLQLQDWRSWVQRGIADEVLIQIYRSDLESYLPQLSRPEVQETQRRIPTAIAVMSGLRNRPNPIGLIRQKVQANRELGLGVAFFYFESLWNLGPEPPAERMAALAELFGGSVAPATGLPRLLPPPPLPVLSPTP